MPVSAFMNACLHDPTFGYYATRPGIGRDFITAPETSQVFGELLGLWAVHEWRALGQPSPLTLAEVGPGRGALISDAMRAAGTVAEFTAAADLHLVEPSETLRPVIADRLTPQTPTFHNSIDKLPDRPLIMIANEWLDCLPARQFIEHDGEWHERVLGLNEDGDLAWGLAADAARAELATGAERALEIQPGLEMLVGELTERLRAQQGRALIIDYGAGAGENPPGDSLRAYREGQQVDPLVEPGACDLTVDVDFPRLKRLAEAAGLSVHGPVAQGPFLLALGAEARLNQLAKAQPDKAQALYAGVRKLVDPAEMGARFKVICLSSPGLPDPAGF